MLYDEDVTTGKNSDSLLSHHAIFILSQSTHHLFIFREPALPDPIKLLRRIHALENAVRNLQQDCHTMMERRQTAVLRATDQLGILRDMCQQEVSPSSMRVCANSKWCVEEDLIFLYSYSNTSSFSILCVTCYTVSLVWHRAALFRNFSADGATTSTSAGSRIGRGSLSWMPTVSRQRMKRIVATLERSSYIGSPLVCGLFVRHSAYSLFMGLTNKIWTMYVQVIIIPLFLTSSIEICIPLLLLSSSRLVGNCGNYIHVAAFAVVFVNIASSSPRNPMSSFSVINTTTSRINDSPTMVWYGTLE